MQENYTARNCYNNKLSENNNLFPTCAYCKGIASQQKIYQKLPFFEFLFLFFVILTEKIHILKDMR